MTDIFREVDEDLRREQYKALWSKYGAYVLALAALIVIATAGWRVYQYFEAQKAADSGDRFVAAMNLQAAGKNAEAAAAFDKLITDTSGRYPVIAALASAGAKAAAGDKTGAVADFDKVANDGSAPQSLRDLARIRAAAILVDTADLSELQNRIGIFDNPNNPYRAQAREILGLAAWRTGDLEKAKQFFTASYVDVQTPQAARLRAQVMLQLIDGATNAAPAAPAAAAGAAPPPPPAPAAGATQ